MNFIDLIESRRIKLGINIEELCRRAGMTHASNYIKYRDMGVMPGFQNVVDLMNAVGYNLVAMDDKLRNPDKIMEWGTISLYIHRYKDHLCYVFEKITGFRTPVSRHNSALIKTVLFYVWYHKTTQNIASNITLHDVVYEPGVDMEDMIHDLSAIGLITLEGNPSNIAYQFFMEVSEGLKQYLESAELSVHLT